MIYKFKFEVCGDDNKNVFCAKSEESGSFWWAFNEFIFYVSAYAKKYDLGRIHEERAKDKLRPDPQAGQYSDNR